MDLLPPTPVIRRWAQLANSAVRAEVHLCWAADGISLFVFS